MSDAILSPRDAPFEWKLPCEEVDCLLDESALKSGACLYFCITLFRHISILDIIKPCDQRFNPDLTRTFFESSLSCLSEEETLSQRRVMQTDSVLHPRKL